MSQHSASSAPGLYEQEGEQQSHSVESQRLVSEDHSHYILIKGEAGSREVFITACKRQLQSLIFSLIFFNFQPGNSDS